MGARIERTAPHRLEIEGVDAPHRRRARVIGDRLEAEHLRHRGGGHRRRDHDARRRGRPPGRLPGGARRDGRAVRNRRPMAACTVGSADAYRPADVETAPYPGFATDFQAPLAVLMTQADGVSTIHETIYEDRLEYTMELVKMGAVIEVIDERHARIAGPEPAARPRGPDRRPARRRDADPGGPGGGRRRASSAASSTSTAATSRSSRSSSRSGPRSTASTPERADPRHRPPAGGWQRGHQ